ncbi:MAG: hypothetical protein K2G93_00625 [Rikenella sp.]|nr:hypothetical protein [Rikenella sp.]
MRELESYDERQFLESLPSLCYLRNEKTLDWMEHYAADKIQTVSPSYGHLAALSHFDWARCLRWLRTGRPLSLIALDALYSCTLRDYAGQSPLLSELQPRMVDLPTDPTEIEAVLRAYQEQDNVTRVRHTVDRILAALI